MIGPILDIVNKFIPDQSERDKAKVALETELTKQMSLKADVITQEMRSKKSWRRRFMLICAFIVAANFVMYNLIPYFIVLLDLNVYTAQTIETPLWLVDLLKMGLGGYISSETVLYGIEKWKK